MHENWLAVERIGSARGSGEQACLSAPRHGFAHGLPAGAPVPSQLRVLKAKTMAGSGQRQQKFAAGPAQRPPGP